MSGFSVSRTVIDMGKRYRWVYLISSLLLLASCASTKVVDQWTDPGFKASLQNVMVLSLNQSEKSRRFFEDKFLKQLKHSGIRSSVSYKLLPDYVDLNKEMVKAAIAGSDIDAVLVLREVKITKKESYRQVESPGARDNFYHYVGSYGAASAVETVEDTVVHLESNLYAVTGAKLIWSGKVEIENPKDKQTAVSQMAEKIVEVIGKTGFIRKSTALP